ncbi:hypothetical protein MHZ92_11445 [Sporosarcina sp. ACRSL]|uniref:hypothetical protein n=1 Tax=Sporosarcina sp. ACRSL TaxID=2918215 RepID=UPI001EF4A513|nr:hypothetical protein [Sporosarcina sp. ACRSL]MCG7344752.1 hypothetical protein [Sporosarcina sp. ACRSL]
MTKNKKIMVCVLIAFIFGVPFKWLLYKGEETLSIFQVFDLGIRNINFDLSLLTLNTIIIYMVWSAISNSKNKKTA